MLLLLTSQPVQNAAGGNVQASVECVSDLGLCGVQGWTDEGSAAQTQSSQTTPERKMYSIYIQYGS